MNRIAIALCLLALGLATNLDARAQGQTLASVVGIIRDSRGEPLSRVRVIVRAKDGQSEDTGSSNQDGRYAVTGLDPGDYAVIITEPIAFRRDITLAQGQTLELDIRLGEAGPDFVPVPDRWRLKFPLWQRYASDPNGEYPFVPQPGRGPYRQSVLKGDLPIVGNETFLRLTGVLETPFEYRNVPTPAGVSTERYGSESFFGNGQKYAVLPTVVGSLELFHGSTSFKPRDWAIRVTPTFNVNYVKTQERGGLNASPGEPSSRRRQYLALQEGFGELKLFDIGQTFDFVSVRAGIQPFNSDFRGFVFRDTNMGVRLFGTWARNRNQWNIAYFDQLEKDTNSELNTRERRDQQVVIANLYREDFLTEGYTISPSFLMNVDKGVEFHYDENGFLVRPSPVGDVRPHEVRAYYIGLGGDGHLGRLNLTHQFYQVLGRDDFNGIAGREVSINAQFAAVEFSVDRNWWRPRIGAVWASGDDDPDDDQARGFDAIVDAPNIAGGAFSFWNREGLPLAQAKVELVGPSSVLAALRSSKSEGQSNFVNPGILIATAGVDAQVTTKLRTSLNFNYLRFQNTAVLKRVLFQSVIDNVIGMDASAGFQYRPALNDNVTFSAGFSLFMPGTGFKQISTERKLFTTFAVLTFVY